MYNVFPSLSPFSLCGNLQLNEYLRCLTTGTKVILLTSYALQELWRKYDYTGIVRRGVLHLVTYNIYFSRQVIMCAIGQQRVTDLVKSLTGYLVPTIWKGRKE